MASSSTTFLQRAVRPRSFEFAWLCGGSVFVGITAMLAIAYGVAVNRGFHWETTIDGQSVSAVKFQKVQQTGRGDQCEVLRVDSPVMERENTWSNLAYLLVGLVIVCRWPSFTGGLFGIYLTILAFFSGLYHASIASRWQTRDIAGLDAALIALVTFAVDNVAWRFFSQDWKSFTSRTFPPFLRVGWVVCGPAVIGGVMAANRTKIDIFESTTAFIIFTTILLMLIFASALAYYACPVLRKERSDFIDDDPYVRSESDGFLREAARFFLYSFWGILLLEVGVAAAAFTPRLLDGQDTKIIDSVTRATRIVPKLFCSPDCWVQAHAVWHVFSAGALLVGYEIFVRIGGKPGRLIGRARRDFSP